MLTTLELAEVERLHAEAEKLRAEAEYYKALRDMCQPAKPTEWAPSGTSAWIHEIPRPIPTFQHVTNTYGLIGGK